MADYTHEYSDFPTSVMSNTSYLDVDDTVATLINQLKSYQANGDYGSASNLIAVNPTLKQYIIGVDVINKLVEEIRNAQIYAKSVKQTVFVQDTEPTTSINGDVWIGV